MSEVIYKIRVNRPCRLFIDDEEVMILQESKLTKITLPEGEYLRKVVAIDNNAIYDEAEIVLSGASKLDNIVLDTTGLEENKLRVLPKERFQVDYLMYEATEDGKGVVVSKKVGRYFDDTVIIPEEIVYANYIYEVREIGDAAFMDCYKLKSVAIPKSVTRIGSCAFYSCVNLTSLTIPINVIDIDKDAFLYCGSLSSINVEEGNPRYDSRGNCNAIIETDTNTLLLGCHNTVIPKNVVNIGDSAFLNCVELTSIVIPYGVTSIGKGAFAGCEKLNNITIPDSVVSIGDVAFSECRMLTSIIIPNSVTKIGGSVFSKCNSLASPIFNAHCFAFMPTSYSGAYSIPKGIIEISDGAFYNCSKLTSIVIPNSVTKMTEWTFYGCSALTSIVVEDGNPVFDSRNNCNAIIESASNILLLGCLNTVIPKEVHEIIDRSSDLWIWKNYDL